jgi:methylmalonyl-CoA mutase cobalamin-binding domain/chain
VKRGRSRRAVVVLASRPRTGDRAVEALVRSLSELGVETVYLGVEDDPCRIAAAVAEEGADTVELCLNGGGVMLLRRLLGELGEVGRRDVSIVLHRLE